MHDFANPIKVDDETKSRHLIQKINHTFHQDIKEGLFEIITVDPDFYPEISVFSKTKESARRVFWRTKQNLDMIYLMSFCRSRGTFYVHLEDDIIARVINLVNFYQFITLKPILPNQYQTGYQFHKSANSQLHWLI